MKIDLYTRSDKNMAYANDSSFWKYKVYMRIIAWVPLGGGVK